MMGGGGMNGDGPPTGAVGIHMSNNGYSYAAYIERQVRSTTIMMYTLVGCAPCQRAKHMLAVHYADVKSHFLELVGDEDWQRQLQVDLQHVTGAMTFPYIFVCGNYIGGSTDLIALHQSGQLRRMVNSCSRKVVAKAAVAAVAASV
uniref:Glutaredoxin domain-containing protein n=1 Tax=Panagrolaimus sp. PS1159 TaxID=55785 RepID=A0AC35GFJ2_9BILA